MTCPICEKRKAKRVCPAKAQSICAVCCGEQREVTIDCPHDCPHLKASREHTQRRPVDPQGVPFTEVHIPDSFASRHDEELMELAGVICSFAAANPAFVDSDAQAALQSLAETYRSLSSGIIYEKPPDHRMQREVYQQLQAAVKNFKARNDSGLVSVVSTTDQEWRDVLILLTQLAYLRSNGRPKSRAFLDVLRSQFAPGAFNAASTGSLIVP